MWYQVTIGFICALDPTLASFYGYDESLNGNKNYFLLKYFPWSDQITEPIKKKSCWEPILDIIS